MSTDAFSADNGDLHLAQRLRATGEIDQAALIYQRVLEKNPSSFAAHYGLAATRFERGEMAAAADLFARAFALDPSCANAAFHRGVALTALGRLADAALCYEQTLAVRPLHAGALQNLISSFVVLKRFEDALALCARALGKEETSELFDTQAIVLHELGRPDDALGSHDRAVALDPKSARARFNRGKTLQRLGRFDEALASYDEAVAARPDYAAAHLHRGLVLCLTERRDEALASYDRALALCPDYPSAHLDRGLLLLALGRFDEGWRAYELRKRLPQPIGVNASPIAEWNGEGDIEGRSLLVYAEQGRGDAIQFFRFARLAAERGAHVIVEAERALLPLLASDSAGIAFVASGAPHPPCDLRCALMSLPLAFHVTPETVPAQVPYLRAEPDRIVRWRDRIGDHGFKIGVAWQGARTPLDIGRSIPLRAFAPLAGLPGVRLISLQKGYGVEQLADLPPGMTVEVLGDDFDAGPDAFLDCAGVMANLDLIVSSDTAIAHLAGALARPAWIALQRVPDWRWMFDRSDTPWYPSLQLFRQQARGDWTAPFAAMRDELAKRLAQNALLLGRSAKQSGDRSAAERAFRDALACDPENFAALFGLATILFEAAEFIQAAALYARACSSNPRHAAACFNCGVALTKLDRRTEAIAYYEAALERDPDHAPARRQLVINLLAFKRWQDALAICEPVGAQSDDDLQFERGCALNALARHDEAAAAYEAAIRHQPGHLGALQNLASTLIELKRHAAALDACDKALSLRESAELLTTRGVILKRLGRETEAIQSHESAIIRDPECQLAHYNLGVALGEHKRLEQAIAVYQTVLNLNPRYASARRNRVAALISLKRHAEAFDCCEAAPDGDKDAALTDARGVCLAELGRFDEALATHRRAVALDPSSAEAHSNWGGALHKMQRFDEAVAKFDEALTLDPGNAHAYLRRGVSLLFLQRFEEALHDYDRSLALDPDYADALFDKGLLLLLRGRFAEGLPLYDLRSRVQFGTLPPPGAHQFADRAWRGDQSIAGKTLLIYDEQGFGDTIQAIRYVKLVKQHGARPLVFMRRDMQRVLGSIDEDLEFAERDSTPDFDFHCALMSLPLAFGTTLATIPASGSYLRAEPSKVEFWRERIGPAGFKIGVAWQGSRANVGVDRSFLAQCFEPIARLPGVRLISLQKGDGAEQVRDLPTGMAIETLGDDFDAGPDRFVDCAAAMMNLDLVISPDTSTIHLAGALGRPAWLALLRTPDWRWLLDRDDSPWYPSLRLFRQKRRGDWASVFAEMEATLRARLD